MIRALIELIFAVVVLIAARAILTTVLKGLLTMGANVQSNPQQQTAPRPDNLPPSRALHKDPVCGTYVADSTPHKRQVGGNTFFYCSEQCFERHHAGAAVRS